MAGSTAYELDKVLGRRVMMLRQVVGLTRDELARRCGLSFAELSDYETCQVRIPASLLYQIAHELGSDVAYFFEGPDYVPRPKKRRPQPASRRPAG